MGKVILLIDPQDQSRGPAAGALAAAGFSVFPSREFVASPESREGEKAPDLVVLSCAKVGAQEWDWIRGVIAKGWPLWVLSASLPWEVMRSVFVSGADDVTEKPYDPERLALLVGQTLRTIASRDRHTETLRRQAK